MIRITLEKLVETYEVLKQFETQQLKAKLSYVIGRNMQFLEPEYKSFKKSLTPPPGYEDYEKERLKLIQKYGQKTPAGHLAIDPRNPNNIPLSDPTSFNTELAKVASNYKDVLEKQKMKEKEIQELLEQEVEVQIFQFSYKLLPTHLTPQQMRAFMPMILDVDDMFMEEDETPKEQIDERPMA